MHRYRRSSWVVSVARAVAVVLGVGIFATGVAAVFGTENGTGAAALLAIGAALVVVAVLGDRIQSVELYGVSLTIKDMARETFALAKSAARKGDEESAERLRAVGNELRDLASEYRRLREFRRSGARRTAALEEVMARARQVAKRQALEPTEVSRWFEEGAPEARVVALGLMQGDVELRDFDAGVDAIENSRSAFEQYHGLLHFALMLAPDMAESVGVSPGPDPGPGERDHLRWVVERAMRGRHMRRSTHRTELARVVLKALEKGVVGAEDPPYARSTVSDREGDEVHGELKVRPFRDGDAEAVLKLHDLALERAGAHGGHGPWEDDLHDIRATYLDDGGCFLVGMVDGALIAMGGLIRLSSAEAEIKRMRVHPDFQRRGHGRQLLEQLERRAASIGCRAVRLDTTDRQTAARKLYESAGYRETGQREVGRFLLIDYAKALGA